MYTGNEFEFFGDVTVDDNGEEVDIENVEKQDESQNKQVTMSEDSYKKALWAHYHLPLDAHPTQEKLEGIHKMVTSGDKELEAMGKELMLGCLSSYILSMIKSEYRTYMSLHLGDMMQQGYEAVIKNVKDYDPAAGMPTTFYSMRIRHGIQSYINNLHGSTPHYTSALKQIREFIKRKRAKNMEFTLQDMCIETGLPMATILRCIRIKDTKKVSIDSTEILDALQSNQATPEEIIISQEKVAYARRLIEESNLTNKERICVCLRYGIGMTDDRTHSYGEIVELAESYGYHMNQPEIQKTIANAHRKMKDENGRIKRAAACHKIRTDIDRRISGDMISKMSMLSDQEAVFAFFNDRAMIIE